MQILPPAPNGMKLNAGLFATFSGVKFSGLNLSASGPQTLSSRCNLYMIIRNVAPFGTFPTLSVFGFNFYYSSTLKRHNSYRHKWALSSHESLLVRQGRVLAPL